MHDGGTYPASDANGLACGDQFGRTPKWTRNTLYLLPWLQCDEVLSAFADRLDYQCDGASRGIRVSYSQRDSLSMFTEVNDDELSGPANLGYSGCQNVEASHIWAQTSLAYDLVHKMSGFSG
jgi:hypothetical protein